MVTLARSVFVCMLVISSFSTTSMAATIVASTDRHTISINDSFNLIFEAEGSVDGEPDFSMLNNDFDILNNSQSSSFNIINGQTSRTTRWVLTVFPKRVGTLTIPSIAFGQDKSNAFQIKVQQIAPNKKQASEDIFIDVNVSPKNPYVQAQAVYTVKLYYAVGVSNANLSEPKLPQSDALIEALGDAKQYETRLQNRRYQVYERKFAIFPQKSGQLTLEPILFNAQIQSPRNFYDPFGSSGRMVRQRSKAITLDVRPIPKSFTGKHWLPATRFSLSETWAQEPPVFKTGEPLTRSITIRATGLTQAQLPELHSTDIDGFKLYPDKPYLENQQTSTGVTSMRQEKIAFIPVTTGQHRLPAIDIPWWNTKTDRQEIAHLAARSVNVLQGENDQKINTPRIEPSAGTINTAGSDTQSTSPTTPTSSPLWKTTSLVLAIGWLITIIVWYSVHTGKLSRLTKAHKAPSQPLSALRNAIKKAALNNDTHASKDALLAWGSARWPQNPATSLHEIASRSDKALSKELTELSRCLYSKAESSQWKGAALWAAFQQCQPEKSQTAEQQHFKPLHKI